MKPYITMSNQNVETMKGEITGLYGDVLQGWALDYSQLDLRLVIEIFIDGSSVVFVRADEFHPGAKGGDKFNGFAVQLRDSWLTGAKVISARVANHQFWLTGDIQLPAQIPAEPAPAASQVWHTGGLKVSGWAFDAKDPNRAVTITIREGTTVLATALANHKHHALFYKASRNHGFEIDLPWSLADGQIHTLQVQNDLGETLSGSPLILCYWPEGVEALLRKNMQAIGDEAEMEMLARVARHQEAILPKSVGFDNYPQWFEVFQKPEKRAMDLQMKCGVLIISDGDDALDTISHDSASRQNQCAIAIDTVSSINVLPGLIRLMEQGCESIVPVCAGDRLAAHALDYLSPLLEQNAAWAYGDCDSDSVSGERSSPWLKPVWDIDLFIGADIFSPGAIFARGTVERAIQAAATQWGVSCLDWQMFLASAALITEQNRLPVVHLPKIIYHRHSDRPETPAKFIRCKARETAVSWLVDSIKKDSTAEPVVSFPGLIKACWSLPSNLPKVSIMIPTRDQVKMLRTCVEGVLTQTDYPNIEVIIIDNDSRDPETLSYMAELQSRGVIILPHPFPFNYAAVNNRAAEIATGEFLCLLNNDIEILENNWLKELISEALLPDVGIVGAKLLWEIGMVQHAGVVIGINGLAAHIGNDLHDGDSGYLGLNQITHQRSSVTGACMIIPRHVYLKHGGMDESAFPVAFNDVDLCLRVRESGLKVKISAFSKLIHAESASRGKDITDDRRARANREHKNFIARWTSHGQSDPFYHPGLTLDYLAGAYTSLALPPKKLNPRRSGPYTEFQLNQAKDSFEDPASLAPLQTKVRM